MAKTVFIYCLKDPRNGDVRYVGKTDNLKGRLKQHLTCSSKLKNHLGHWLLSLNGDKPILAVLHEVAENESWQEEERRYISCARAMGVDLVNSTEGGDGFSSGEKHPFFGKPLPPSVRARMSRAAKGRPKSPEHKAAIGAANMGRECSAAMREAIRSAKLGRPLPLKTREKMSLSRRGEKNPMFGKLGLGNPNFGRRPSEEEKAKTRAALLAHYAQNRAKTGVSRVGKKRGKYRTKTAR